MRAGGALLCIALHAAIPYMRGSVPELLWAVHDSRKGVIFDWIFWWLRAAQVPLFLLMSGFFTAARLSQGDIIGFLRTRWRRLMLPFLAGLALVLPILFAVWARGWVITGRATWYQVHRLRFAEDIRRNLWGSAHLWYLGDLFVISVVAALAWAGVRALRRRGNAGALSRFIAWVSSSRWGILVIVASSIAALAMNLSVLTTHRNTFMPIPWRIVYYATIFAGGIWAYRSRLTMSALAPVAWPLLALAAIPMAVALRIMGASGSEPPLLSMRLALAASLVSVTWLSLAGLVGLAWQFRGAAGRITRTLSADAYWIYVVHLPIVGALQIAVLGADWPASAKFTVVFTGTAILAAASGTAVRKALRLRAARETNLSRQPSPA